MCASCQSQRSGSVHVFCDEYSYKFIDNTIKRNNCMCVPCCSVCQKKLVV